MVEHLGCLLDKNMSGEAMARMVLKIFLYKQNRYISYPLKRMLWNTLIQSHYDFACSTWYTNLSVSLKTKLQSKYCLELKMRSRISKNELEKINCLLISNRVYQCLAVTEYSFKNDLSPKYMGNLISTPCRFLQTLRHVDQLTILSFFKNMYPFLKKKFLEN